MPNQRTRSRAFVRVVVLIAVSAIAVVVFAPVAQAAPYRGCDSSLSKTTLTPGESVTASATGDCFEPNTPVTVTIESTPVVLGHFTADSDGGATATVTIPSDFPLGDHTIKLTGTNIAGNPQVLSLPVTIAASAAGAAPAAGGGLAFTGSNSGTLVGIGAALMVLGAGLVAGLRRRRRVRPNF